MHYIGKAFLRKYLAAKEPAKMQEMLVAWEQYVKQNNVLDGTFDLKYGFQTCLYEYCFK